MLDWEDKFLVSLRLRNGTLLIQEKVCLLQALNKILFCKKREAKKGRCVLGYFAVNVIINRPCQRFAFRKSKTGKGRVSKTTAWKKKVKKVWGELIVDALPKTWRKGGKIGELT